MTNQIDSMSSDEISKMILEQIGLCVQKLVEPGIRKEADFLARYENETFLIEAKLKGDDKKELAKRERELSQGKVYVKQDVQGRSDTISGALKQASSQLITSAKEHDHNLRLVMHISKGINARAKAGKATDTLLGRMEIFDTMDGKCKPCYFYGYSDFYTRRHAFDAAIIGYIDHRPHINFSIYLNPFSPRYEIAKESVFLKKHNRIDPVAEEAKGEAYIPNKDVSVSNSNEMIEHLCKKYKKRHMIPINFNTPEIVIRSTHGEDNTSN